MKRHGHGFIVAAFLLIVATPAPAVVINGSFESGFAGWNTIGDTSIQGASIGISPRDGASMALITTLGGQELPYSGTSAAGALSNLQGFFGYSFQEILDITEANPNRAFPHNDSSAIRQTIVAQAGQLLSFDFYYLTSEVSLSGDQAFFTYIPAGPTPKQLLFLNPSSGTGTISPVDLCSHAAMVYLPQCGDQLQNRTTGWQHFDFEIPSTGLFTFGFGVWEQADDTIPSALFVDNVRVTAAGEPHTIVLSYGHVRSQAVFKSPLRVLLMAVVYLTAAIEVPTTRLSEAY